MNLDQIKGNWKKLSGELKSDFGKLTEDELMQAEGDLEKLSGLVQEKYGISKQLAADKIDMALKKMS